MQRLISIRPLLVGLLLAAAFLVAPDAALAESPKIGVIDFQRVLAESKKGQEAKSKLEAEQEKRAKALEKMQEELRTMQEDLQNQQMLLSEEMQQQKQEQLRQKVRDFQRRQQDYTEEMKRLERAALEEIQTKVQSVVDDYAKENGLDLVIGTAVIAYYSEKVDITDKVIARLDRAAN